MVEKREVKKEEVEKLLKYRITDSQFCQAFEYAKHKQAYQYQQERKEGLLQHFYLAALTAEYVRNLGFSKYTAERCRRLRDMEKERPVKTETPKQATIL